MAGPGHHDAVGGRRAAHRVIEPVFVEQVITAA